MTPPHQHNPNAKRILIVCDEGLNRSATIRGQIQYWGHDCLTVGLNRNGNGTLDLLTNWADLVIFTEKNQLVRFANVMAIEYITNHLMGNRETTNYQLWDIGPDNYPRPYNKDLLEIVRKHIQDHKDELKP